DGGFQGTILVGGREVIRRGRPIAVLRPNVQVIGGALGDLLEDGRRSLAAIVALFWLIQHHRDAKLRIVRGEKTNEGGEEFIMDIDAMLHLLSGAGLAGDGVMLEPSLGSSAVG